MNRTPIPDTPNVWYIDNPWRYSSVKTGGSMTSGAAAQYATLSMSELIAIHEAIAEITADNAVLATWATPPMNPEAFRLIAAAGFTYKAKFYWDKIYPGRQMGLGAWNRGGTEELLIATRGRVRAWRYQRPARIAHPVLRHSRKPAVFRDIITRCTAATMPDPRRIELFARNRAKGWASTGLELDGRDIRKLVAKWPANEHST